MVCQGNIKKYGKYQDEGNQDQGNNQFAKGQVRNSVDIIRPHLLLFITVLWDNNASCPSHVPEVECHEKNKTEWNDGGVKRKEIE